ncbi:MAG: helix-turn-helix domain-containing protein [Sedimentisphaeraceae bacterium JB056]
MLERFALDFDLQILNTDLIRVGRGWNWKNVNSPFTRLYYAVDGGGAVEFGGVRYDIRPGNMYLIPCFEFHDYYCKDFLEHYFVHFTSRLLCGLDLFTIQNCQYQLKAENEHKQLFERLIELNPDKKLYDIDPKRSVSLPENIGSIDIKMLSDDPAKAGDFISRAVESRGILNQLIAPFLKTATGFTEPGKLAAAGRFAEVLHFIDENLQKPITLSDMAEVIHLNPTYFSNLFADFMGERPVEYLSRKRIERAQLLLLSTNMTLKEISGSVGFSEANYFSRVFSKHIGMPPQKYRYQERER